MGDGHLCFSASPRSYTTTTTAIFRLFNSNSPVALLLRSELAAQLVLQLLALACLRRPPFRSGGQHGAKQLACMPSI